MLKMRNAFNVFAIAGICSGLAILHMAFGQDSPPRLPPPVVPRPHKCYRRSNSTTW